jgi:6-phosphofructokinase 1
MEQLDHLDNRTDVPGKSYTTSDIHSCIVGIRGADIIATPITSAKENADLKKRRCKDNWWMPLRDLIRVLGKREYQIAKI